MKKNFGFAGALIGVLSLAACGQIATSAPEQMISIQAVTIDDRANGFVGKGDVQLAFGWNNAALQRNAAGVDFLFADRTEYDVTCSATVKERQKVIFQDNGGGNGDKEHTRTRNTKVTITETFDVVTSVTYDVKTATRTNPNGNVTGFNLTGFEGLPTTSGSIPVLGASCSFEDEDVVGTITGTITDVTITDTFGDTLTVILKGTDSSKVIFTSEAPVVVE